MAIKSETFGGVSLSGEDARKFDRQVRYGRPAKRAQETLDRGDALLQKYGEGTLTKTKVKSPS